MRYESCQLRVNDTKKNIKYAKNICVSRCIEIRKNQNENYNKSKTLIFEKIYTFIKNIFDCEVPC
jgi:hypothetical protein